MTSYFHGGVPGLQIGDRLLPPDTSGTTRTVSEHAAQLCAGEHATRRDLVYVTTERQVARAYAAFYPDGALYRVIPCGPVVADPDHRVPGISWHCPLAIVQQVIDPAVLFRGRTLDRWLRMLNTIPIGAAA